MKCYKIEFSVYRKSVLHNVSDIFVMGGCLILEALVLFYWCQQQGFGPLGVTGLSMGGHVSRLIVTLIWNSSRCVLRFDGQKLIWN